MSRRAYGQYCGLARALEMVGERWALLIVRDLLVGPRRFTDLRAGLPRIPTNILSTRLKEMEAAGVVQRRVLPRPSGAVVYELTDYGRELEDAVLRLGRWGARALGEPGPEQGVSADSMVMALRSTFRAGAAEGTRATFELRMGELVLHAVVRDAAVAVAAGTADRPDVVIESGPAIRAVMAGELTPAEALDRGQVRISGDPAGLDLFARLFRIG